LEISFDKLDIRVEFTFEKIFKPSYKAACARTLNSQFYKLKF